MRLVDVHLGEERLQRLRLALANAAYCQLFTRGNADGVAAGVVQLQAAAA